MKGREVMNEKKLNLQYALINALFYSIQCMTYGYASVFLLDKGLNNSIIGIMLASASIISVFGQSILASYLDRSNKVNEKGLLKIISLILIVFSAIVAILGNVPFILIIAVVLLNASLFIMLPFINSLTFIFEKRGIFLNYGIARGVGSAGYALMSLFLGYFLNLYSPSLLPYFYTVMAVIMFAVIDMFKVPKESSDMNAIITDDAAKEQLSIGQFLKKYNTLIPIFLGTILMLMDSSIIASFMIHIVESVGGTTANQGTMMFIQAMAELPTMFAFTWLVKKLTNHRLMQISVIAFSIKNVLTALAVNIPMLYGIALLQAFGYALFTPASVYFIAHAIDEKDLNKGQALMTASMMMSSVFATLVGGVLFDLFPVRIVLVVGAILSVLGTLIILNGLKAFDSKM